MAGKQPASLRRKWDSARRRWSSKKYLVQKLYIKKFYPEKTLVQAATFLSSTKWDWKSYLVRDKITNTLRQQTQSKMFYNEYQKNKSRKTPMRNWMRRKFLQRKRNDKIRKMYQVQNFLNARKVIKKILRRGKKWWKLCDLTNLQMI